MAQGISINFLFNQMRDYNGSLAGGTIEFFKAGTTEQLGVALDVMMTQPAANPYMLSANGTAELFANGMYRIVVKNADGVIVYEMDQVELFSDATETGGGGGGTGTGSITTIVLTTDQVVPVLLTSDYHQIVIRSGIKYNVEITAANGYPFSNGMTTYTLYSDNESAQFIVKNNKTWVLN